MKSLPGFCGVGIIAGPGIEGWILEGACETEGNGPGERTLFDDGCEIIGGLLNRLTAGEENDTS